MVFGDGFHQSHRQIIAGNWRIRLAEIEASLKTNQGNTGKSQVGSQSSTSISFSTAPQTSIFAISILSQFFESLLRVNNRIQN